MSASPSDPATPARDGRAPDAAGCALCGAPTPAPPVMDGGRGFCCHGCSTVFRTFGSAILAAAARPAANAASPPPQGAEAFLRIEGMHCSSCEILIERCAAGIEGIHSVSSSYATSTARIVYDPGRIREADLPRAIGRAGYRASLRTGGPVADSDDSRSLLRVITGAALAATVMMLYLAFFYPTHLGLVAPGDLEPVGWLAFTAAPRAMLVLTTLLVFLVGAPILRGAWIGFRARVLNMDNLLAIAILAAYGYSAARLFTGSLDLYFDVAAVIVAVVTTGRYFEQGAKADATRELARLTEAWAPAARTRRDGGLRSLPLGELRPGDRVLIRAGEPVPVDGRVVLGQGAVDESLMTGEPFPAARGPGEAVLGGTRLVEGGLEIEVGAAVSSQVENLARVLWSVQGSTAGVRGFADRIARVFVPAVLALAALVSGWLLLEGAQPGAALLAGLATLIVSCPCTFGLAVPLTTATAVGAALRHGILVTSADTFAKPPRFDIFALDKTGTLSTGRMSVVEVLGPPVVAARAAAVERLSSHPIAAAIAGLDASLAATDLRLHPGKGAEASVEGRRVVVGGRALYATLGWEIPARLAAAAAARLPGEGVISYVGWEGRARGAIVTRDRQRPEWEAVIDRLRENGRVILLTGAEHPSGYEERADAFHAGIPPEAKAAVIRQLRAEGRVVMVGDGSNDAPALAAADLGIAFGTPTPLAAEAADIVIPGDRLERVFTAFELIRTTRRRVRQNIGWALLYNAVAIPLAVTGVLNPLFAALAMATSSLLVVWNSSRPFIGVADLPANATAPPADAKQTPAPAARGWAGQP